MELHRIGHVAAIEGWGVLLAPPCPFRIGLEMGYCILPVAHCKDEDDLEVSLLHFAREVGAIIDLQAALGVELSIGGSLSRLHATEAVLEGAISGSAALEKLGVLVGSMGGTIDISADTMQRSRSMDVVLDTEILATANLNATVAMTAALISTIDLLARWPTEETLIILRPSAVGSTKRRGLISVTRRRDAK